jgi:hypothetical protein
LVGGYLLCIRKDKTAVIILGWFLLAPIAGATARETPHALRSETFIPIYEVIAGVGAYGLFVLVKHYTAKLLPILYGIAGIIVVFSLTQFWHSYLIHNPVLYSSDWQYGYKQTIQKVAGIAKDYDKIYFTDTYGRAYIYVAWYTDMAPEEFWQTIITSKDAYGLYNVTKLGKYEFTDTYQSTDSGRVLYVTSPSHIPARSKTLSTVSFLDGDPAFVISEKL